MTNFITNPEKNLGAIGLLNLSRFGFPRCDFRCHLLTYLPTYQLTYWLTCWFFRGGDALWKPAKAGIMERHAEFNISCCHFLVTVEQCIYPLWNRAYKPRPIYWRNFKLPYKTVHINLQNRKMVHINLPGLYAYMHINIYTAVELQRKLKWIYFCQKGSCLSWIQTEATLPPPIKVECLTNIEKGDGESERSSWSRH